MITPERPLDLLNSCKGKKVLIQFKDSKTKDIIGVLIAFDIHINLVVQEKKLKFIRGDNILWIEPFEE